jgi:ubiquitin C-terminal hydrolase
MLSVLLETLHEDVNAITKKPYVEYKDSDGRSDEEISKEFWDGFKKRENSIFVDLFYGQLKSRVQCTQCDHVSLTFDPFNVLSLPVPTIKNMSFSIKYIPWNTGMRPMEFMLSVGEFVTVNEIR